MDRFVRMAGVGSHMGVMEAVEARGSITPEGGAFRQKSKNLPPPWMSSSGLHTSFALAATMPVLVLTMRIWNVLARGLLVFQDALLTFICPQCRIGVVCGGLPRLVFLHHRKSFRDGHGIQPPECCSVA